MKPRIINSRWELMLPDHIADWDALDDWERARFADMEERLSDGQILYDVGAEHGELSAIYSTFVGGGNMVLVEPSPYFWPNIRLIWQANYISPPLACVQALCDEVTRRGEIRSLNVGRWPECADGDEQPARSYAYIHDPESSAGIAHWRLDQLALSIGVVPDAITIDVEGAELAVLKGAHKLLGGRRPTIWVSIHPKMMRTDYRVSKALLLGYMNDVDYEGHLLGIDHEEHWRLDPR